MEQNIYLDVYFGFNFLMDFFVLYITGKVIKNRKPLIRIVVAGGLGGIYATVIMIFRSGGIIEWISTYLIMASIMLLIAFGKTKIIIHLKRMGILYGITFGISGLINTVYYSCNRGKSLIKQATEPMLGSLSIISVMIIVIIGITICDVIVRKIKCHIETSKNIVPVKIRTGQRTICVNALYDTGNSLVDPMTGKPVSVIDETIAGKLDKEKLKILFIPYNSVGRQHGMLEGFVAESLELNGRVVRNPVIAIYSGKLSQKEQYNMILHPEMLKDKGEEDV